MPSASAVTMRRAILLAVLLAGCAQPTASDEIWRLSGGWTAEFTQADIDAVCAIVAEHERECVIMESYPPQFGFRFPSEASCESARERILRVPHTIAGACARSSA